MKKRTNDLIIIGGGIMGLFTAYYASKFSERIIILEKRTIGNKYAASSGYTRSIRNDYLNPFYARLAAEARQLWEELEQRSSKQFIIRCGVLNIARSDITPNLAKTYAQQSFEIIKSLGFATERFNSKYALQEKFPQFEADLGSLDIDAGLLYIPPIMQVLKKELRKKSVKVFENSEVVKVERNTDNIVVRLKDGRNLFTENVVLTVGAWSIKLLDKVIGCSWLKLPVVPVKQVLKYFHVPEGMDNLFSAAKMPVFAYLDVGIYGHPVYGRMPGLKVAYFDPFGAKLSKSTLCPERQEKIRESEDFIRYCLPKIKTIKVVKEEVGYYQMTPDNDFIVGELPAVNNIFIGAGFCGTGYKFAPLIGKSLAEMVFRGGTIYDLSRFSPKRFGKISDLSFLKTIPIYVKFFQPQYWKYLKIGMEALTTKSLP